MKCEESVLVLEEGSGRHDIVGLKRVFETCNIPAFVKGDRIQVLVNEIPIGIMRKIMKFPVRNHMYSIQNSQTGWRHFENRVWCEDEYTGFRSAYRNGH